MPISLSDSSSTSVLMYTISKGSPENSLRRQLQLSHALFNVLVDGMTAFFNVTQCYRDTYFETPRGRTKKYYIAAEEITWNYMTEGKDLFSATDMNIDHGFSRYNMLVSPSLVII